MNLEVMWRLLHLTFWLSAATMLLFMWIYIQRGQSGPALADAIGLGATALGYGVSVRLGRPKIGIQAIAIIDWLLLAVTITLQGDCARPARLDRCPCAAADAGWSEAGAGADRRDCRLDRWVVCL